MFTKMKKVFVGFMLISLSFLFVGCSSDKENIKTIEEEVPIVEENNSDELNYIIFPYTSSTIRAITNISLINGIYSSNVKMITDNKTISEVGEMLKLNQFNLSQNNDFTLESISSNSLEIGLTLDAGIDFIDCHVSSEGILYVHFHDTWYVSQPNYLNYNQLVEFCNK